MRQSSKFVCRRIRTKSGRSPRKRFGSSGQPNFGLSRISDTNDSYSDEFTQNILSRSELSLLGVEFSYNKTNYGVKCTATMSSQKSRGLYETQIGQLSREVNSIAEGSLK